jgi:hypothetical protein
LNLIAKQGILAQFKHSGEYAERLVADLSPEEMTSQPVVGVTLNHPSWILSHLAAYPPVLMKMLQGIEPDDPMTHQYGQQSVPLDDPGVYPPKDALVAHFLTVRHRLAEAFNGADEERLGGPVLIERWKPRWPSVWHACVTLMVSHDAVHLGQLSAWRRAGARPSV